MATGRITIDWERCKGCDLCSHACPKAVIELSNQLNSKGYRPAVYVDPLHICTGCALCAVVCPDSCITVYKNVRPSPEKRIRLKEEAAYDKAIA